MKGFFPVVSEVKNTLRQIALFDTVMNSLIMFLAVYCVLSLFNLFPYVSIIPAVIYFIVKVNRNLKNVKLINVEKMYPGLFEKLITAADTVKEDNLIVQKLREDVVTKLRKVKVSSFIDAGTLSLKIVLICLLFFLTIFVTSLNIHVLNLNDAISGTDINFQFKGYVWDLFGIGGGDNLDDGAASENESEGAGNASFEDIYGEMSVATLKGRKLEMSFDLQEGSDDFKNIKDIEDKSFNEFPPEEIVPTPADYDESIVPKEQQKLIKDYFEQINR